MHILIAPDSFKGSLTALEAAETIAEGLTKVFPAVTLELMPVADGGPGTVSAIVSAMKGSYKNITVFSPVGEEINTVWGILPDGKTAVLELAGAGNILPATDFVDPLEACSYGTGQLVKAALDAGATTIVLGIGGGGPIDGGVGFLRALGARSLDADGKEIECGGAELARLHSIDISGLDPRLAHTRIRAAYDSDAPLCGPRGAAFMEFQRGATREAVTTLDAALRNYAAIAECVTGRTGIAETPGAGAAGGLGAALLYFTEAELQPGMQLMHELSSFEERVSAAHLVITGEGRTDFQTAFDKAPAVVARIAHKHGIPVICLSGSLGEGAEDIRKFGVDVVMGSTPGPMRLEDCMRHAREHLLASAERLGRVLVIGASFGPVSERAPKKP